MPPWVGRGPGIHPCICLPGYASRCTVPSPALSASACTSGVTIMYTGGCAESTLLAEGLRRVGKVLRISQNLLKEEKR